MYTISAFICGLCATASALAGEQQFTVLEIFDHYSNNSLVYDHLVNTFKQQGFVNFGNLDFVYGRYADDFPVLFVIKPDPSAQELHGYYFPKGFASFSTYGGAEYEPIRKYFYSGQLFEAYTPYAVQFAHPDFYNLKMTKFVHGNEVLPQFNVVFLVPKVTHPEDFVTYYNPIIASIPK